MGESKKAFAAVRFEGFELDLHSGELRKNGTPPVRLPEQSFQILAMLLEHPGKVVSRREIQQRLWPDGTVVEFEHSIGAAMNRLRQALGDSAENASYIETLTRRGYRWMGGAEWVAEVAHIPQVRSTRMSRRLRWALVGGTGIAALGLALSVWYVRNLKVHQLAENDRIVLADFTNATGEAVFDDALRQGLEVQLQQSPFLNLVSGEQIRQTLQMMKQPSDAKLTPEIAREVCQRTNGTAVLVSAISAIGTQYQLILKAVNCSTGESLAGTEARARDKDQILDAIGKVSSDIRSKLGESLTTIQKLNAPLAQATTPSLEALKAYSLGLSKWGKGDQAGAIPLFQQAIELDPDFAMAYLYLGQSYAVLGEYGRRDGPIRKAFELRERASERERFEIVSAFHQVVTYQSDQAIQNCELWEQSYPSDVRPHSILGFNNGALAKYERSAEEFRKAMELDPAKALPYAGLMIDLMALNRFAEARGVYEQAQARKVEAGEVQRIRYLLAFVESDAAMMAKLADSLSKQPGYEGRVLWEESRAAAYFGRLDVARELSRRSTEKALLEKDRGTAAVIESDAGIREALFGNLDVARNHVLAAKRLRGQSSFYALAIALSGDAVEATKVVDRIANETPPGSLMGKLAVPEFRGAIELKRGNATRALEFLASAEPYEAGWYNLYRATYLRGEAYLLAHRGSEAAAEFQKIIDHRGTVVSEPFGALAHLGLARSYTLQGEIPKARTAMQDFLALWKDADPNIPILKQAKVEYLKLQ
jgi:DNA-binding winged helix-turn-helix (wHTH) protein/tetratricopeptide (TPR) repeat protein